jgi:hypothetical protein
LCGDFLFVDDQILIKEFEIAYTSGAIKFINFIIYLILFKYQVRMKVLLFASI